jgi:hypothetical protein
MAAAVCYSQHNGRNQSSQNFALFIRTRCHVQMQDRAGRGPRVAKAAWPSIRSVRGQVDDTGLKLFITAHQSTCSIYAQQIILG